MSESVFTLIDDKHVPLYRVLWVAKTPHFCGREDCDVEGRYEIRLEQSESVWASGEERDQTLQDIADWHSSLGGSE